MALTLVYTGEHYVIDVLVGWLYAALTVAAVTAVRRRERAVPASVPA
jgi:membrane-associated phospholipid phosphatase